MSTSERPRWRTSTRSSSNQGNCVKVADNLPGRVLVHDSSARTCTPDHRA